MINIISPLTKINKEESTKLRKLIKDYHYDYALIKPLENLCIRTIIKYIIDFSTYDVIDLVLTDRSSSIVIGYQLIKKLCEQLNVKHLIEKFLTIYANIFEYSFSDLLYQSDEIYGICYKCYYSVITDNYQDTHYLGICEKEHKMIWTSGEIDDKIINRVQKYQYCLKCQSKCKVLKISDDCKVILGENNRYNNH